MKKIIEKLKESYTELVHKTSWPTRAELGNSAMVVMFASVIIALVISAMDLAFENIMQFIYKVLA